MPTNGKKKTLSIIAVATVTGTRHRLPTAVQSNRVVRLPQ